MSEEYTKKALKCELPCSIDEAKGIMFHIQISCVKAEDQVLTQALSKHFDMEVKDKEADISLKALTSMYITCQQMEGVFDRYDLVSTLSGEEVLLGMVVKGWEYDETANVHKWVVTFYPDQSIFK